MEDYTLLRQFADSWMLLVLFLFFLGVVAWVFRPGSRKIHKDTANIPFRHSDTPAAGDPAAEDAGAGDADKPAQKREART